MVLSLGPLEIYGNLYGAWPKAHPFRIQEQKGRGNAKIRI